MLLLLTVCIALAPVTYLYWLRDILPMTGLAIFVISTWLHFLLCADMLDEALGPAAAAAWMDFVTIMFFLSWLCFFNIFKYR